MNGDNGPSFQRPYWILLSGSMLIRMASNFTEWPWVAGLKPWEHYIPTDPEELLETVEFARSHDNEMLMIAQKGIQQAQQLLKPAVLLQYIYLFIKDYAKLFPIES